MVCKETHRCPEHGFLLPEEVSGSKCKRCSTTVEVGPVEKMSKSKKNIVDPDGIIARYGADTTRLFSLFAAPPERDLDWNIDGVEGSHRFLSRVWRLVLDNLDALESAAPYDPKANPELGGELKELRRVTHKTIEKVTVDIEERYHFNTAISSIMELVNALYKFADSDGADAPQGAGVFSEAVNAVILLLSPFAPHISEELWEMLGNSEPLYKTRWPTFDAEALAAEEVTLVVQINGKVRSRITLPLDASKEVAVEAAKSDPKVAEWTKGKETKKIIYVPNRILNMVVH
jgi:leucyl-tRNA synthetase